MSKQIFLEQKNSCRLEKQLTAYSIAAGAVLAAASAANAAIIYTDVNPDAVLNTDGATFDIDFGTGSQLKIQYRDGTLGKLVDVVAKTGNASWLGYTSTYNGTATWFYASALNYGSGVKSTGGNPNTNWSHIIAVTSYGNMASRYNDYYFGAFVGTTDKYLGVKFRIGGNTHYGWIQVQVPTTNVNQAIITGYAYNDTIEGDIGAGIIPEAGSLALLAIGASGLAAWRKKRS